MIPVEWLLVFLLYVMLVEEMVTHVWVKKKQDSKQQGQSYSYRPRCQASTKRDGKGLDNLWRRMQQATQTLELNGLRHDAVTETMAKARAQARRLEQQKIAQAKLVDDM